MDNLDKYIKDGDEKVRAQQQEDWNGIVLTAIDDFSAPCHILCGLGCPCCCTPPAVKRGIKMKKTEKRKERTNNNKKGEKKRRKEKRGRRY